MPTFKYTIFFLIQWFLTATDEDDKKRGVSMGKSKAGTKERSPDSLSQPNQNRIIIKKIW